MYEGRATREQIQGWVANQAHWLARNAKADGNLGAQRDKFEVLASFALLPSLGQDFFPATDAGALALHVRLPLGTRIEESAADFDRIEARIREIIPADQLDTVIDNIGIPLSGIDMAYSSSGTIGPQDGDIQISLKADHSPTADYVKRLREALPESFPGNMKGWRRYGCR